MTFVEIHVIQNYAPSNLNRDELGNPKTAIFGGMPRSRISSQCLKHAIRRSPVFIESLAPQPLGTRSKQLPAIVQDALLKANYTPELVNIALKKLEFFFKNEPKQTIKKGKGKGKNAEEEPEAETGEETPSEEPAEEKEEEAITASSQLLFYSPAIVRAITETFQAVILDCKGDATAFNAISPAAIQDQAGTAIQQMRAVSPDIALFGRMTTINDKVSVPVIPNIEAAVQVAHALSTHALETEYDYYTAVDDLASGVGTDARTQMIGDIAFTGSCYYKYANIDVAGLCVNLRGKSHDVEADKVAKTAALAFINGVIRVTPTGKQNSFAAFQLPDAALIEVRARPTPVSYANAFAKPITNAGRGVVWNSIDHLARHANEMTRRFELTTIKRLWFTTSAAEGCTIPVGAIPCETIGGILRTVL